MKTTTKNTSRNYSKKLNIIKKTSANNEKKTELFSTTKKSSFETFQTAKVSMTLTKQLLNEKRKIPCQATLKHTLRIERSLKFKHKEYRLKQIRVDSGVRVKLRKVLKADGAHLNHLCLWVSY